MVSIIKHSDFAQTKDTAIQYFLHFAHDHMVPLHCLAETIYLDSPAYLCNVAFELMLKAMHLSEHGQYMANHSLIELYDGVTNKIFTKNELPLIKVIDMCNLSSGFLGQ
jgi:hypothetical protein